MVVSEAERESDGQIQSLLTRVWAQLCSCFTLAETFSCTLLQFQLLHHHYTVVGIVDMVDVTLKEQLSLLATG